MTRYGPGEIGRDDGVLSESKRRHSVSQTGTRMTAAVWSRHGLARLAAQ